MVKAFLYAISLAVVSSLPLHASAATPAPSANAEQSAAVASSLSIDLNAADADTLTRELKGIGATKAKAIIEYRDAHGPFASIDELLEVKGIGAATLEKNRDKLVIQ